MIQKVLGSKNQYFQAITSIILVSVVIHIRKNLLKNLGNGPQVIDPITFYHTGYAP